MILYISVTIIVICMGYFCHNQEYVPLNLNKVQKYNVTNRKMVNLWVCSFIFLLLSSVSACRIAVGNEYWVYWEMFSLIAQGRHVSSEIGVKIGRAHV